MSAAQTHRSSRTTLSFFLFLLPLFIIDEKVLRDDVGDYIILFRTEILGIIIYSRSIQVKIEIDNVHV